MRRLLLTLLAILAIGAAWWYVRNGPDVLMPLEDFGVRLSETAQETFRSVSTPPPLRKTDDAPGGRLTVDGVFSETNRHRAANGAAALQIDARLTAAAEAKLKDMFDRQYFAHESPDGEGPADLAADAGYAYIQVGENLALGNFADDRELVQAWMDSPGHRANILETAFTEIGIAVGRGTYEGKLTWMAVQEFGRPMSDCPRVDATLAAQIDADRAHLDALEVEADALRAELEDSKRPRTEEERDAYNAKVDAYNALVREINALVGRIQGEITVYNGQVQAYNTCAQGG